MIESAQLLYVGEKRKAVDAWNTAVFLKPDNDELKQIINKTGNDRKESSKKKKLMKKQKKYSKNC